jgi:hypothetical protein
MTLRLIFRLPWMHHLVQYWMQFARSEVARIEATRFDWPGTGVLRFAKPT